MSKRDTEKWFLYIDESGNFREAQDSVCVAGVLLRNGLRGTAPGEVRLSLERAVPGVPWPLHATHLRQPSYVALAITQSPASREQLHGLGSSGAGVLEAVEEAVRVLTAHDKESVDRALKILAGGRRLPLGQIFSMHTILREQAPNVLATLDEFSRRAWVAVRELFVGLLPETSVGEELAGVGLITASETELGDAFCDDGPRPEDDRYYELLGCVLERAASVLSSLAPCELGVRVLERSVFDPRFGKTVPLGSFHVNAVIKELALKLKGVRVIPELTASFDQDVCGEFVLADFVANQSRRILSPQLSSLKGAEGEFRAHFAVPVRSGAPSRSHLAASGLARDFIETPGSPVSAEPSSRLSWQPPRRRWACEQAWEWVGGRSL